MYLVIISIFIISSVTGVALLSNYVENALEDGSKDFEDRIESLNIVKMTFYIYSQFFLSYMNKMALKSDPVGAINVKVNL